MNKINIKNEVLKEKIYYQLKKEKTDKITIDDIKNINNISLNAINIKGDKIEYDFQEVQMLKYLNTITLSNFLINDKLIEVINSLENLNTLILNGCDYNYSNSIIIKLTKLIVVGGKKFDLSILNDISTIKSLRIIYNDEFDVNNILKITNLEELYLCNSNVKNIINIIELKNLKILNLDGSKFDDCDIINKLDKNIKISFEPIFMYKD